MGAWGMESNKGSFKIKPKPCCWGIKLVDKRIIITNMVCSALNSAFRFILFENYRPVQ